MKLSIALITLILSGLTQAAIEVGSYYGVDTSNKDYELHIQELPERKGSFLGLLISEDSAKIRAYLIDRFTPSKYGMLTMKITDNYNFGLDDIKPALALTSTPESLVITQNADHFTKSNSITFKTTKRKPLRWQPLIPGSYSSGNMTISPLDAENEAVVYSKIQNLSGDFVLRESKPGLYLLLSSTLTPTGVKLKQEESYFAVFMSGSRFSAARMILIDSKKGTTFTLKNK